jgi:hypothetical protein
MASSFLLANMPHMMWNLCKSDTATVWFDIADFQLGASAKRLSGTTLQIGPVSCYVHAAHAHPGTPLCQCCWCWGHSTKACCAQAPCCPRCSGPHTKASHCSLAGCCKGNPLMKPPIPATPKGAPCPHAMWCVNCKGSHSASDKRCPFWRHCFNCTWLSARIAGVLEVADVDPEL